MVEDEIHAMVGRDGRARSWPLPLLRVVRNGGWLGHDALGDVLFVKHEGKVQGRINVVAKAHVTRQKHRRIQPMLQLMVDVGVSWQSFLLPTCG